MSIPAHSRLSAITSHISASASPAATVGSLTSSSSPPPTTFHGYISHAPFNPPESGLQWGSFTPKKWTDYDIDIAVTHCGICGSDLHTLRQGWGGNKYPVVVGHEIIGHAIRIGSAVSALSHPIQLGDRVGVGAQAFSCHASTCNECSASQQNHCRFSVDTYNGTYPSNLGHSYGGYATHVRVDARFVFKIPDTLPSDLAAPLLCAGVTVFSPLKALSVGPGKSIAIIGVGGLGHLGILLAKAMGCSRVIALSRNEDKRADALALGADEYYPTSDKLDPKASWSKNLARSVDGIICTVSSSRMPLRAYLRMLKVGGRFVMVGAPDGGEMPPINVFQLISGGISVGGSAIGSPDEIRECLQFCAEKGVRTWVKSWPMSQAEKAVQEMEKGSARYRFVLVNDSAAVHGG